MIWPDASVRWISAHGSTYYSVAGKPTRMVGVVSDITLRKRAETLAAGQKKAFELAVGDAPLSQILDTLARASEWAMGETLLASILLFDAEQKRLRHGAGPSLPLEYNRAIDGIAVGPAAGSCGTAAYLCEPVIVSDIAADPRWAMFRDLALPLGLRACSIPGGLTCSPAGPRDATTPPSYAARSRRRATEADTAGYGNFSWS